MFSFKVSDSYNFFLKPNSHFPTPPLDLLLN